MVRPMAMLTSNGRRRAVVASMLGGKAVKARIGAVELLASTVTSATATTAAAIAASRSTATSTATAAHQVSSQLLGGTRPHLGLDLRKKVLIVGVKVARKSLEVARKAIDQVSHVQPLRERE